MVASPAPACGGPSVNAEGWGPGAKVGSWEAKTGRAGGGVTSAASITVRSHPRGRQARAEASPGRAETFHKRPFCLMCRGIEARGFSGSLAWAHRESCQARDEAGEGPVPQPDAGVGPRFAGRAVWPALYLAPLCVSLTCETARAPSNKLTNAPTNLIPGHYSQ